MEKRIPDGVWPTMITPFTDDLKVDFQALEQLVEWYVEKGAAGLFAVCLSSEMFYLTLDEKAEIAGFVGKTLNKRIPFIVSGHTSDTISEQIVELNTMAETGADAVVLVTNRLAEQHATDDQLLQNLEIIMNGVRDIPLGFYECPHPYNRQLTPRLLKWCADSGRFAFSKDTSCNLRIIEQKLQAVEGSAFKIFNAHLPTLLGSLKLGASGYSSIIANFIPELLVWLVHNYNTRPEQAETMQDFLGMASLYESLPYPTSAKYYQQLGGLEMTLHGRSRKMDSLEPNHMLQLEHLYNYVQKQMGAYTA